MRRALPWLLCVVAVAVIVAPIAQGTSSAKDPRVAGLIVKVNALQAKVNGLQSQLTTLVGKTNCLGSQAVVLRGAPAQQDGYLYAKAGEPNNLYLRTAFDAPTTGEAPSGFMATVASSCVTASNNFRASHAYGQRPAVAQMSLSNR
jgi:hypothetical protein